MTARLLEVAPADLLLEANVRTDARVDAGLVASIAANGVLQPPTVVDREDGLHVIVGQRRTLAAVEAGLDTIPVLVVEEREADQLLVDQIVENDARAALTDAERVAGYKQLALLGVGADRIAKRTGAKRAETRAALKIAESTQAVEGLVQGELTFDAALAVAELEVAEPEAVPRATELLEAGADPQRAVAEAVDDLRQRRQLAEWEANHREAGWEPIEAPSWQDKGEVLSLDSLFTEPQLEHALTVETAAGYQGRVVWQGEKWTSDGYVVVDVFGIRDYADQGLHTYSFNRDTPSEPDPVEEAKQAAEKARVKNLRKQWRVASEVRRGFIRELLQRRTLPDGWERVALRLVSATAPSPKQSVLIGSWLGVNDLEEGTFSAFKNLRVINAWAGSSTLRASKVLLAAALADLEGDSWFQADGFTSEDRASHISTLQAWGYEPSTIETEGA